VRIIEIFHSIQGEGPYTGFRTSFVRTARCNLRCAWCDTPYSFGPGKERSIPSILTEVARHRTGHACLTGGEPLLQKESVELLRRLGEKKMTTVVETGGSLDVGPYLDIPGTVLSVDVKCPSSKMEGHNRWANLPLLRPTDIVKFVVQDRKDYRFAKAVLAREPMPSNVVLQPVHGTERGPLADWVLADRLDVRVMVQEHKVLFGDVPGR
jgi:7-carboxy-7-deazaguanine synthase